MAITDPSVPAICTDGPSRPRLMPLPMLRAPATNFTHVIRGEAQPNSFQNASFNCGMPLPAAAGPHTCSSTPESSEAASMSPSVRRMKVSGECSAQASNVRP